MRLFRENQPQLERLAQLHGRLPSAELVLHPPDERERYLDARQLEAALTDGTLVPVRTDSTSRFAIDPRLERVAARLAEDPSLYIALRPRAARMLAFLSTKVYELSGEERPLAVTRATYDEGAVAALTPHDPRLAAHDGVHATGFSFDIRRRYGSRAQAAAFQWTLERLEALGLIAWTRGESVIHLVVSPLVEVR
jgi:hypothetical protein